MCPIFKNTEISRDDIGEYMREFAEENDIMPKPRRSLIGSLKGEKILLAMHTPPKMGTQVHEIGLKLIIFPSHNDFVSGKLSTGGFVHR
ncbi:hypothetical protein QZH41_009635, partial [Actinostola sp. cb2023]